MGVGGGKLIGQWFRPFGYGSGFGSLSFLWGMENGFGLGWVGMGQ